MNRTQAQPQPQVHAQAQAQSQSPIHEQAQASLQAHPQSSTPAPTQMQAQIHADTLAGGPSWHGIGHTTPMAQDAIRARAIVPESFTLDEAQADTLIAMIEEERLAGDVYEVLAEQTGLIAFDRIAASEDRHHDTLVMMAQAAGIDLSAISDLPAGEYADPGLQALYDNLIAQAGNSTQAALDVGAQIETLDIADLQSALVEVVGTPLWAAYSQLLEGSQHHLAAFDGLIGG